MGLAGPFISAGVGLLGASSSSASYHRAAQETREQSAWNAKVSMYSGEVAAQKTQYDYQAEADKITRNVEVVQQGHEAKQAKAAFDSEARRAIDVTASAADAGYSPNKQLAIAEQNYRDFLERQRETVVSNYQQRMFLFDANQTAEAGIKQAYNQRISGIFESQKVYAEGNARANSLDSAGNNAMTEGILGAGMKVAGGIFG